MSEKPRILKNTPVAGTNGFIGKYLLSALGKNVNTRILSRKMYRIKCVQCLIIQLARINQ